MPKLYARQALKNQFCFLRHFENSDFEFFQIVCAHGFYTLCVRALGVKYRTFVLTRTTSIRQRHAYMIEANEQIANDDGAVIGVAVVDVI